MSTDPDANGARPHPIRRAPDWWDADPPARRLAGVFEGGGLKGVAYAGALRGVVDEGAWFGAVAGASAGAVTAALVAAGASPDDLEDLALTMASIFTRHLRDGDQVSGPDDSNRSARAAHDPIRPSSARSLLWHGRMRLRNPRVSALGTGNELVQWLDRELHRLADTHWPTVDGRVGDEAMTFEALFHRTGIELVVVAVDAISSRHCIFSHATTPRCGVAEAAIASSSIPFVLRPRRLEHIAGDDDATRFAYPIIDGGVWTNFPTFVFDDLQFRRYHGLQELDDLTVIGFLLNEPVTVDYRTPITASARFVTDAEFSKWETSGVLPAEVLLSWRRSELDEYRAAGTTFTGRMARHLKSSTSLTEALDRPHEIPGLRITPKRGRSRKRDRSHHTGEKSGIGLALDYFTLVGEAFWLALVAWLVTAAGFVFGTVILHRWLVEPRTSWRQGLLYIPLVTVVALGAALLFFTLVLLGVSAIGYLPLTKTLAPVASLYVRGSGAPYWLVEPSPFVTGADGAPPDNIVLLSVHPRISTLRIDADTAADVAALVAEQSHTAREQAAAVVRSLVDRD